MYGINRCAQVELAGCVVLDHVQGIVDLGKPFLGGCAICSDCIFGCCICYRHTTDIVAPTLNDTQFSEPLVIGEAACQCLATPLRRVKSIDRTEHVPASFLFWPPSTRFGLILLCKPETPLFSSPFLLVLCCKTERRHHVFRFYSNAGILCGNRWVLLDS
jgi:hypothetical protein